MNLLVWAGVAFVFCGCTLKKTAGVQMADTVTTHTFSTELEKLVWLNSQVNQSMTLSIRCTFEPLIRQCYLGLSNTHPITIDDTRLGIPLSEVQTTDGWVQVEGIWRPESDGLSVEQVDLRVDKVLSGSSAPLVVLLH